MTAEVMDGEALAAKSLARSAERAAEFLAQVGRKPSLATVLVGDDPASHTYVRMKSNRSARVGIESHRRALPSDSSTDDLRRTVAALSEDPAIDGILLQHPVPPQVDERAGFEAIDPQKDVDGVTMHSFAAMSFGEPGFVSCTPGGIMRLLAAYEVDLNGLRAVVIGRSPILGKPIGMLLLNKNATVTYCHSRTRNLRDEVARAELVVAAVGQAELIKGEWIRPGAVVVDAGYNPGNVGDVEYAAANERARLITPVPGGVGPMTIATLLEQTVDAAFMRQG